MITTLVIVGVVGSTVLYIAAMKLVAKAIEADERADSDFGYYGRYNRLDSF
ncbi:hypothetical protein LCGC14_1211380 [marine sediment metagenome]|uniref:Uncharacterized protein n=1 Tax=marine sediment metagenome TaxID=412755 RepID=A0A0F9LIA7_9ZZZZ